MTNIRYDDLEMLTINYCRCDQKHSRVDVLQADTKTHFTAVERLIEDESVLLHHLLSMVPKMIFSGTILCGRGKYTMTHNMSLKQRFIMTFVFSTAGVLVVKYGQICQICTFGCAKYGQVGCPWKWTKEQNLGICIIRISGKKVKIRIALPPTWVLKNRLIKKNTHLFC